ncbi:hypothetical protein ACFKHW_30310 [Bradyrhizobium lupini]|uniref:hypothetical protein n=1 Tax=Rhizobium lupini TaxID=136996 RepID=UPI00366A89FE
MDRERAEIRTKRHVTVKSPKGCPVISLKPLLPSSLQRGLPFLIPADWTPEQALAVFELLDDLFAVITGASRRRRSSSSYDAFKRYAGSVWPRLERFAKRFALSSYTALQNSNFEEPIKNHILPPGSQELQSPPRGHRVVIFSPVWITTYKVRNSTSRHK